MSTLARFLHMSADVVEDFQSKARDRYNEQRESGVDSQAVVDALATLTASIVAGVAEVTPKPRGGCQCDCGQSGTQGPSADVAEEVEKAFGRLGLVQETELAALRKRVADLESRLPGSSAS